MCLQNLFMGGLKHAKSITILSRKNEINKVEIEVSRIGVRQDIGLRRDTNAWQGRTFYSLPVLNNNASDIVCHGLVMMQRTIHGELFHLYP